MRRIPFDPPWTVVPLLLTCIAAAAVVSSELPVALVYVVAAPGIAAGTLAMERWYTRRHPARRAPRP